MPPTLPGSFSAPSSRAAGRGSRRCTLPRWFEATELRSPSLGIIPESWSHSLEAKPRRLPIFWCVLGPALRAKRFDRIRALILIICLAAFPFRPAARAFMRVSAELAHNLHASQPWIFRARGLGYRSGPHHQAAERPDSLHSRQRCVQGTASRRALEICCLQTWHAPNVPCLIRPSASSIARKRRLSVWCKRI